MTSYFDLDALKASDYGSYVVVSKVSGQTSGPVYIDLSALKVGPDYRFKLAQASLDHEAARAAAARAAAAPPPPPPVVEKPAEPAEPQISMAEIEAQWQKDLNRAADQARGLARLRQFQQEQGLRDCKENADAIRDWLDQNCEGYISQDMIDACVVNLGARGKNILLWDSIAPPAPPAPSAAEPQEVLQTLPDGTKQLPLNATNAQVNRASKEQARDWLKRFNGGKMWQPRARGGFASRF